MSDPILKQQSLQKLLAWKEAHKNRPKEGLLEITILG
jgi:hypothetical protein